MGHVGAGGDNRDIPAAEGTPLSGDRGGSGPGGFDPTNVGPGQQATFQAQAENGGGPSGIVAPASLMQAVIDLLMTRSKS